MNFDDYKFRSHSVGKIVSVPKPLTNKQSETLNAYRERANGEGKPLTPKQRKDWHALEHKQNESNTFKLNDTAKRELTVWLCVVPFSNYAPTLIRNRNDE